MPSTPQLSQLYNALADQSFSRRPPKEQELMIAQALRAADFTPQGEDMSLHELAEDAGIDLQASEQHSGFARAKATADRIGFGASEKFASGSGIEAEARREYEGLIGRGQQSWVSALYREAFPGQPPLTHREMIIKLLEKDYGKAVTAKVVHARAGARARFGKYDQQIGWLQAQMNGQRDLAKKNLLILAKQMGTDVYSSTADAELLQQIAVKLGIVNQMWKAYDGDSFDTIPANAGFARRGGKDSFAFSKEIGRKIQAVKQKIAASTANLREEDKAGNWSNCYSRCVALSALYGDGGGGLAQLYRDSARSPEHDAYFARAGGKALMGSMPRTQEEMWKALTDPNFRSLAPWRRQGLLRQARTTSWWRPPGAAMNMGELADTLDGGPGFNPRPIVRARDDHARPGPRGPAVEIDRDSIQRWEDQNQKRLTSAGRSAWVFDDPSGKAIMVPGSNTYAEAVAWLKKNALTSGTYKLCMQRPESSAVARRLGAFARDRFAEAATPSGQAIANLSKLIRDTRERARRLTGPGYSDQRKMLTADAYGYELVLDCVRSNDLQAVKSIIRGMDTAERDEIPDEILAWAGYRILRPKGFAREGGPAKPSASAIAEMKALIKKAKAEAEGASRPSDRNWWMEEAEQYEAILQAVLRNDPHEVSVIADGMSKNAADRIPMAIITWGDYAT